MKGWLRLFALALTAIGTSAATATDPIPPGVAVQFNTACALCHEGECSGRLSFDRRPQAADNHIQRYAGEISADARRDLYVVLEYMKRECRYYPIAVVIPKDRHWGAEALGELRNPGQNAYFIPIGQLPAGSHRVVLRFAGEAKASVQVISADFDIVEHPGLRTGNGIVDFVFTAERKGEYFLRLQTDKPAVLLALEIAPSR